MPGNMFQSEATAKHIEALTPYNRFDAPLLRRKSHHTVVVAVHILSAWNYCVVRWLRELLEHTGCKCSPDQGVICIVFVTRNISEIEFSIMDG